MTGSGRAGPGWRWTARTRRWDPPYRIADGVAELEDLFVDPPWMRRGLGAALVRDISATMQGLSFATLEVTANPQAPAFYERLPGW